MAPFIGVSELLNHFCPSGAIGAEIGVHHAETSLFLMNQDIGHLYAIDPYFGRDDRYKIVTKQLLPYDNYTLIRKPSHDAASIVPDNLDFVFIDGDHSYEAVLEDLHDWVSKIRSGGLLIGHDWTQREPGVVKAGTEYFQENYSLFKPLISNEKLERMGLAYKIAGSGYIHKQRNNKHPLWWRIKL